MLSLNRSSGSGYSVTDKYIVLQGIYRKLKTNKKKYFVLFSDSGEQPARIEYYDSEKKFRTRKEPAKRSIVLKECFHINKRVDTKYKYVISIYTKDDCFCIIFESESDQNRWLKAMQTLVANDDNSDGDKRTSFGE